MLVVSEAEYCMNHGMSKSIMGWDSPACIRITGRPFSLICLWEKITKRMHAISSLDLSYILVIKTKPIYIRRKAVCLTTAVLY